MNKNKITMRVNGVPFTQWEDISISRSITELSGSFRFNSTNRLPNDYPVKAGDAVQILLNGSPVITGFVDDVTVSGDTTKSFVAVSGRDNTADLIDSSVPDAVKDITGFSTISSLCQSMINGLGAKIKVINKAGKANAIAGSSEGGTDYSGSSSGSNISTVLTSFARKSQVYLIPSGDGGLVVYRPVADVATDGIYNERNGRNNNVKRWSLKQAHQDRFHKYKISSQVNFSIGADDYSDGVDVSGFLIDNDIRQSRYLELQAEQSSDSDQCNGRANEQANLRRAKSIEYTVSLSSFVQSDGRLWDIGQTAIIKDEFAGVYGAMFIKTLEITQDPQGGTNLELTMSPPDAFNVTGDVSILTRRSASIGEAFS